MALETFTCKVCGRNNTRIDPVGRWPFELKCAYCSNVTFESLDYYSRESADSAPFSEDESRSELTAADRIGSVLVSIACAGFAADATGTATVTLNKKAEKAITVVLDSTDDTKATVPASVVVPKGAKSADFTATGAGAGAVTFSAVYAGVTVTVDVTISVGT